MNSIFFKSWRNIFQEPLKKYLIIVCAGLLVRLILMPLSVNLDTLLASWWEALWVFKGHFIIEDFNEVILTAWMRILKPLFVSLSSIIDIPNTLGILGLPEHASFSSSTHAMRFIFLLKAPYLLIDLLLLVFIFKFFDNQRQKFIALIIWAFNPFLLYSVYVYGRYEIFAILFAFIALYFAKKQKAYLSIIFFGIAISLRFPLVIILPFFVIYFAKNYRDYIKYILIGIIPYLLVFQSFKYFFHHDLVASRVELGFIDYFVKGSIGSGPTAISLFLLLYPLTIYYFYKEKSQMTFKKMVNYSTIGFLVFYSTSYFHQHYIAWITPFLIIAGAYNKKIILPLTMAAIAFFIYVDVQSNTIASSLMFLPADGEFFSQWRGLRSQGLLYDIRNSTIITIIHSIFVLFLLWTTMILVKGNNENK